MKVALCYLKFFTIIIYHLFVKMQTAGVHYCKGAGRIEAFIRSFEPDNSIAQIFEKRSKLFSGVQYYNHIWKYITLRQVNLTLWAIKLIILHKWQVITCSE